MFGPLLGLIQKNCYKNKKFYYEANESIVLDKKAPMYSATILDNKYSIGFVWNEQLREKIKFGDEIIRVDSFFLDQMDFCDIVRIKRFRKSNQTITALRKTAYLY